MSSTDMSERKHAARAAANDECAYLGGVLRERAFADETRRWPGQRAIWRHHRTQPANGGPEP
jgi:hypothetical protein